MSETGGNRRVRLTPARQRPTPGGGQAPTPHQEEESATEPVHPGQWWRRILWVHIGTVVGAIAAIGSLIFSGIATKYGADVAEDQLTQSRATSEQAQREQAARVSSWVDNGEAGLHVVNRSLDPVQDVVVWFEVGAPIVDEEPDDSNTPVRFTVVLRSLPPCSEVLFERKNFRWLKPGNVDPLWLTEPLEVTDPKGWFGARKMINNGRLQFNRLAFVDADGSRWLRDSAGGLTPGRPMPLLDRRIGVGLGWNGLLVNHPPVSPLENCVDG